MPKIIKIVAWLWIIGAFWKISMTPFSWPDFETWRNIFLLFIKIGALVSGLLLLKGYRQAVILYLFIIIINSVIFYSNPPKLAGIERYFTPWAIGIAFIVPVVFLSIIAFNWKALKWSKP
jgi:hypothetical protein